MFVEINSYRQYDERKLSLSELLGISIEISDKKLKTIRTEDCKQEL